MSYSIALIQFRERMFNRLLEEISKNLDASKVTSIIVMPDEIRVITDIGILIATSIEEQLGVKLIDMLNLSELSKCFPNMRRLELDSRVMLDIVYRHYRPIAYIFDSCPALDILYVLGKETKCSFHKGTEFNRENIDLIEDPALRNLIVTKYFTKIAMPPMPSSITNIMYS